MKSNRHLRKEKSSIISISIILLFAVFIMSDIAIGQQIPKVGGFPSKTITFVIPFGFGGGADTFVRSLAVPLGEAAGVPINSINVVGGGFASAIAYMMNQPADGYTIIQIADTVLLDENMKRLSANFFEDFIVLLKIGVGECQLYVKKDSPFKTFQDMVKYGKENPGKLKIGGSDAGGTRDLGVRQIFKAAGIKGIYIPFTQGTATTNTELLAGRIDSSYDMELALMPLLRSGDMRMLVTSGDNRRPGFPDVPTFNEIGYKNLELQIIRGVAVRKGAPSERVKFLEAALKQAMQGKVFEATAKATGIDLNYMPGEEFTKELQKKKSIYLEIQKELGYVK